MMYNFCLQPAFVQIMPLEDANTYRFGPFDGTKVWPHKDYPLIPFGKLVLNRNPYERDGAMLQGYGGNKPNYEPNSLGSPQENKIYTEHGLPVEEFTVRTKQNYPNNDFYRLAIYTAYYRSKTVQT